MRWTIFFLGLLLPAAVWGQTPRVPAQNVCLQGLSALSTFDPWGGPIIYYCEPVLWQYRPQTVTFLFAHEETHVALHITAMAQAWTLAGRDPEAEADQGAIAMLAGSFSPQDWGVVLSDISRRNPAIAQRVATLLRAQGIPF